MSKHCWYLNIWHLDNYIYTKTYFFLGIDENSPTFHSNIIAMLLATGFSFYLNEITRCIWAFPTAYQCTRRLTVKVPQVNNRQPMRSPDWLLMWFSEPDSLLCFLPLPLKPFRVYLPKQITFYLLKLKRAIWLLISTNNSYLLVSFIDRFVPCMDVFSLRGETRCLVRVF